MLLRYVFGTLDATICDWVTSKYPRSLDVVIDSKIWIFYDSKLLYKEKEGIALTMPSFSFNARVVF